MYQEGIGRIRKSIFPLFFKVHDGDSTKIGVSGTGFFVSNEGHFITAHHVIANVPTGAELFYIGNVPNNSLSQPIGIEEILGNAVRDIFVGKVAEGSLPALKFAAEEPQPGKSVCLSGYPLARLSQKTGGTINVRQVRPYWQPTFVIDGFEGILNQRHYRGFMTQHASLRGMSGGPVFDMEGFVCGVDVATLTRKIPEPDGRETIVANGVAVGVNTIRELLAQKVPLL